jgi:hypothetical protein
LVGDGDLDADAGALAGKMTTAAEDAGALGDARLEADGEAEAFRPAELPAVEGGTCATVRLWAAPDVLPLLEVKVKAPAIRRAPMMQARTSGRPRRSRRRFLRGGG